MSNLIVRLHAASNWLETFADHHQHIFAAIGVFWTAAAVIVALRTARLARRNSEPRLKATVSLTSAPPPDARPDAAPAYIIVQVTNTGYLPITLRAEFLWWRVAFGRRGMQLPLDFVGDSFITKRSYPIELPPTVTDTIFFSRASDLEDWLSVSGLLWRPHCLARITVRIVRLYIVTNRGDHFRAKKDKSLRDHIRQVASSANKDFLRVTKISALKMLRNFPFINQMHKSGINHPTKSKFWDAATARWIQRPACSESQSRNPLRRGHSRCGFSDEYFSMTPSRRFRVKYSSSSDHFIFLPATLQLG